VPIEGLLIDQVEVLRGPATLFYGSGAIGGIVNVVDGRLAAETPAGIAARAMLGRDTGSELELGAARLDVGWGDDEGMLGLHLDASSRSSEDYEIPGGTQASSGVEQDNGALGLSWRGAAGYFGVALSRFQTEYAIPEAEAEEESLADFGKVALGGGESVLIDLEQDRVDLKAAIYSPFAGIEEIELRVGRNDYEHVELEGEEIGTRFIVDQTDARITARHGAWMWAERALSGAFGLTHDDRDFAAVGEEAFVPASRTRALGLFWVGHLNEEASPWHIDLGLRWDRVRLNVDELAASNRDSLFAASLGAEYALASGWSLRANVDVAERAPTAEERYSAGAHIATQAFELGDPGLQPETARQLELGAHWHGERWHMKAAVYDNRYADFIYQADTGLIEDDLPLLQWTQADARFSGAELEASYVLVQDVEVGQIEMRGLYDQVNARLKRGENRNLPRIAPQRFGLGLNWQRGAWQADLFALRYAKQDRTAEFELPTDGYTRVDFDFSRSFGSATAERSVVTEIYLQARNVTDELARNHTSFLKDFAVLPGRNVGFGVRVYW
jgi:iron complex outermembrane recepter protein